MITTIKKARACGVPLIAITTGDQQATARRAASAINGNAPVIGYDIVRGLSALTEPGKAAITEILGDNDPAMMTDPTTALAAVTSRAPDGTVCIIYGAQRILTDIRAQQCLCNARDAFKATGRVFVLLGPVGGIQLPADLTQDTLLLDDAAPDATTRTDIVSTLCKDAEITQPAAPTMAAAVSATRGLSAYAAEQNIALCMSRAGIDTASLWRRWRDAINAVPGLSVDASGATLDDVGGLSSIKQFSRELMAGNRAPSAIVRVEEIEKAMAGSSSTGGDSSGTSQGMLQALLTWMQEEQATGLIAVGPAGSGKSLCSTAIGSAGGVPTITLDLGALKGSLVGQTEQNTRAALATIKALAGTGTFWVATCNGVSSLPVELRRRFQFGLWFFDLPSPDEREAIWALWLRRFPGVKGELPNDTGWTGAEIRTCADTADRLGCSPRDAARWIVPVSKQAPDVLETLRRQATGKYLSASYAGTYQGPEATSTPTAARRIELDK